MDGRTSDGYLPAAGLPPDVAPSAAGTLKLVRDNTLTSFIGVDLDSQLQLEKPNVHIEAKVWQQNEGGRSSQELGRTVFGSADCTISQDQDHPMNHYPGLKLAGITMVDDPPQIRDHPYQNQLRTSGGPLAKERSTLILNPYKVDRTLVPSRVSSLEHLRPDKILIHTSQNQSSKDTLPPPRVELVQADTLREESSKKTNEEKAMFKEDEKSAKRTINLVSSTYNGVAQPWVRKSTRNTSSVDLMAGAQYYQNSSGGTKRIRGKRPNSSLNRDEMLAD